MYVLFSMFSTSVEFGRYWRPFSVFIALKNSPPSSSTILTPLTPSNYSADLLPEDWFHNAGKLLCWPTFAGVRSPSGFVFTYIKLSRSWFGCWHVVRTRPRLWICHHLQAGSWWPISCCWEAFVSTHVCWRQISFWLCVYIYKAQPKVDLVVGVWWEQDPGCGFIIICRRVLDDWFCNSGGRLWVDPRLLAYDLLLALCLHI